MGYRYGIYAEVSGLCAVGCDFSGQMYCGPVALLRGVGCMWTMVLIIGPCGARGKANTIRRVA